MTPSAPRPTHPTPTSRPKPGNARTLRNDDEAASKLTFVLAGVTITVTGLLAWFLGGALLMWLGDLFLSFIGLLMMLGVLVVLGVAAHARWG